MSADVSPERGTGRGWRLSAAAFERLLAALDADREKAALAYEQLRQRIIGLLGWWGAAAAEELAAAAAPEDAEAPLACLDRCLGSLEPGERKLVLRYYEDGKKADVRRNLAQELDISPTALRIRTHRIRERLERRVTACLGKP